MSDLTQQKEDINFKYELGVILVGIGIALKTISLLGVLMMGSIGFISTPSFLINHALLRSSLGLLLIVVSIILGALAYHISKTDSKKGSMLAILASLILPVDVFMLAGGALLFISKK